LTTRSRESSRNASASGLDTVHKELASLAEQIDEAKAKVNKLTGAQEEAYRRLKQDFGCKALPEATLKLEGMEAELKALEKSITDGFAKLKEKYDW
jgi:uncharacterized phage infection (PIP) family protein YhgE